MCDRAWAPARQDILQRFPCTELGRLRGRIRCNASRTQSLGACAAGCTATLLVHRAWAPARQHNYAGTLPVHRTWAPARQDTLQRFPCTELGRLRGRIHYNASCTQSLGACGTIRQCRDWSHGLRARIPNATPMEVIRVQSTLGYQLSGGGPGSSRSFLRMTSTVSGSHLLDMQLSRTECSTCRVVSDRVSRTVNLPVLRCPIIYFRPTPPVTMGDVGHTVSGMQLRTSGLECEPIGA